MLETMETNVIYNESCISGMQKLPENCIDLCVTSPPYDDLRTYNDSSKWDFNVFQEVAAELYRVIKPGGVVVWVIGDAVIKGGESMSSFRQALHFGELGFLLHDTMIYEKNGCAFPSRRDGNRYSQIFEYMFVFSKNKKPKTANLICDKQNKWAGHTTWGKGTYRDKEGNLVERKQKPTPEYSPRNNIWRYNNGKGFTTRDNYAYEHPAMFPEALARDHIKTWSNVGDIVLDPFTGAGTTPAIAREEDRQFLGYEIDSKYFEIATRRIEDRAARLPI
jgi:site-specific DNA-methyltransferase (adenine-specific)